MKKQQFASSGLEGVLLFALLVPIMMKYTLLPTLQTPYWYFGCIFVASISYIIVGFWNVPKKEKSIEKVKNILFWFLIITVLFGSMVTIVADRGRLAAGLNYYTHDIVLQLEAAVRYLSDGKNPYKETYFGTSLESWNYQEEGVANAVNPALYHFVMPPWYLIGSYPFFWVSMRTVGYFDGRMPLFAASIVLFIGLFLWLGKSTLGRLAVLLLAFNPATVFYLLEGRSDMFAFAWLVLSFITLERRHILWSSVFFGLALLSKQTIWFITPIYLLYIFRSQTKPFTAIRFCILTGLVVGVFTLPFLMWDLPAFVNSVVFYLTGNTATGYPVSGYGLGMVLKQAGIIKDIHAYYPFIFWQIGLGVPLYIISGFQLWKKPSLSRLVFCYGVVLFILWYVSRYFNNSHAAYLTSIFLLGTVIHWKEKGMV